MWAGRGFKGIVETQIEILDCISIRPLVPLRSASTLTGRQWKEHGRTT